MKTKLLLATNNPGKINEVAAYFQSLQIELVSISDIFPKGFEVEETGETFQENALLKASQLGEKSNLLTLADDSGLVVDALNGQPGVFSARYAATDEGRIRRVLDELKNVPKNKRTARFVCCLCLYDPQRQSHQFFEGVVEGQITTESVGSSGFGYDPIFYSDELKKTFGQANLTEKNIISHRGRALTKVRQYLEASMPLISQINK